MTTTTEALLPTHSTGRCDHCNTRGADFGYHGWAFCCECMSALTSWMLDGGMVDAPDLFRYIVDDE